MDAIDKSAPHNALLRMQDPRTLTLTQCNNLPFILALSPIQNPLQRALCPKLEELILYVKERGSFNIKELMSMAKARASVGKKLPLITIVGVGQLVPEMEVFKLRVKEYVAHVNYRVMEEQPKWGSTSGDGGD